MLPLILGTIFFHFQSMGRRSNFVFHKGVWICFFIRCLQVRIGKGLNESRVEKVHYNKFLSIYFSDHRPKFLVQDIAEILVKVDGKLLA